MCMLGFTHNERNIILCLIVNYNRVRLKTMTGSGDYINASVVDVSQPPSQCANAECWTSNYSFSFLILVFSQGYKHRGAFLATQAPLETTVEDFWRMIWENQSMAIVMLYDVNESSEPEVRIKLDITKCGSTTHSHRYWVPFLVLLAFEALLCSWSWAHHPCNFFRFSSSLISWYCASLWIKKCGSALGWNQTLTFCVKCMNNM